MKKPKIFSGVQPSGNLHLGNYLGAISQWVEMQDKYDCIFCVVDYHAITVAQKPEELRKKIIEIAKIYIASGINPDKSVIFQQSEIKEHTELAWVLNCTSARISDLNKMTQFKDKAKVSNVDKKDIKIFKGYKKYSNHLQSLLEYAKTLDLDRVSEINILIEYEKKWKDENIEILSELVDEFMDYRDDLFKMDNVSVGLFDYPVLMAADILLYNTDVVPVGDDQLQHVELARDLAKRFNNKFGDTFIVPKAEIRKEGARIMGLDDPIKKMSKSASSEWNYIALTDDIALAKKKIMKATTDSEKIVKYDPTNKPGVSNLLVIESLLSKTSIKDLEKKYKGKMYGDFKKGVSEVVGGFLEKFQERYNKINDDEVRKILDKGAEKLQPIAVGIMEDVKKKIGVK